MLLKVLLVHHKDHEMQHVAFLPLLLALVQERLLQDGIRRLRQQHWAPLLLLIKWAQWQ